MAGITVHQDGIPAPASEAPMERSSCRSLAAVSRHQRRHKLRLLCDRTTHGGSGCEAVPQTACPYQKLHRRGEHTYLEACNKVTRPLRNQPDFKAGQHFFEEGQRMSNFNSLFLQSRYHRWLKRVVAEPDSTHGAGSSVAATTELGRACSDRL